MRVSCWLRGIRVAASATAGALVLILAISAPSSQATPVRATVRSSPAGVALVARVNEAYKHVAAAIITVRGAGPVGHFSEILDNGTVVAEEYVGSNSAGTTMLVAPRGSPTFAREPQSSCWRVLTKSDPQTLDDIGHPLLFIPGATVSTPHTTPHGWTVSLTANGTSAVVDVNTSHLVQSITATHAGQHAIEDFTTLKNAPKLPQPEPRC